MNRHARDLTPGEWGALSPGLAAALRDARVAPLIDARPHPGALVARLWRGRVPILTYGRVIHWPGAKPDFSQPWSTKDLEVLQHELQHVLDFATEALSPASYLLNARNWTYHYRLKDGCRWCDFGAEQRAMIAQHVWRCEQGLPTPYEEAAYREVLPWG